MRLIDADNFMTVLNDAQIEFDENYRGLGLAKSLLSEQPSLEPRYDDYVSTGVWDFIAPLDVLGIRRCSVCGNERYGYTPFCPSCGSKNRPRE